MLPEEGRPASASGDVRPGPGSTDEPVPGSTPHSIVAAPPVSPAPQVSAVRDDVHPSERVLAAANEAVPEEPPKVGTGPTGSIPAAESHRAWSRVQALNWRLFLVRGLSAGLAVVLTVVLLPGLGFVGWQWGEFLRIAVVFGLLNAIVKPVLQFLVLRFIFSTYGIVVALINAALLVLLGRLLPGTFEVYRPVALLFGGLVVGILGMVFETLLGANPPVLDRGYKERNGLP